MLGTGMLVCNILSSSWSILLNFDLIAILAPFCFVVGFKFTKMNKIWQALVILFIKNDGKCHSYLKGYTNLDWFQIHLFFGITTQIRKPNQNTLKIFSLLPTYVLFLFSPKENKASIDNFNAKSLSYYIHLLLAIKLGFNFSKMSIALIKIPHLP